MSKATIETQLADTYNSFVPMKTKAISPFGKINSNAIMDGPIKSGRGVILPPIKGALLPPIKGAAAPNLAHNLNTMHPTTSRTNLLFRDNLRDVDD